MRLKIASAAAALVLSFTGLLYAFPTGSSVDCCAAQRDCCNPPSACCDVGDCCERGLDCCPDSECCVR